MHSQRSAFTAGLVAPERPTNGEGLTGGTVQALWNHPTTFSLHSADVAPTLQTASGSGATHQWMPANLDDIPGELMPTLSAWTTRVEREHGIDPGTLAQAAAHEAGHIVVGKAVGVVLEGARITRYWKAGRPVWGGCTKTSDPNAESFASSKRRALLGLAALGLAGFIGESISGLSHPSSSLDERLVAWLRCQALSPGDRPTALKLLGTVEALCRDLLETHRGTFDAVRGALFAKRRLQRAELARMLASVAETEVTL